MNNIARVMLAITTMIILASCGQNDSEPEEKSLFAGDYTGYLDENKKYLFGESYAKLDLDFDGRVDRVYREYISEGDLCNIELRFGDGSVLTIEKEDSCIMPQFSYLPNEAGKILIAYQGINPGQCGEGTYAELAFYEKKEADFVLSKVPFKQNSYDNESFPQYMDMKVSLVDEGSCKVGYTCDQIPDFYEEIVMAPEDYEAADAPLLFESGDNLIDCTDSMFYRMKVSAQNEYMVECFAHIIYHCEDEFMVGLQYINDGWEIVDYHMVKRFEDD